MSKAKQSAQTRFSKNGELPTEDGTIYKNWGGKMSVALTMPNTYFVGMSSLALQLLYSAFNREPDVVCERIFWEKGAAAGGRPALSLESENPHGFGRRGAGWGHTNQAFD